MAIEPDIAQRPSRLALWVRGARPRTLTIALAPILVGAAKAATLAPRIAVAPILAAALSALAIQIATNLANDAADGARGADGAQRLGPRRLAGSGLMPAAEVAQGARVATLAAALFGLFAIAWGGWPILAIGVASIAAGWAYSYGPRPISASPFGEVFVVAFFGVAAVGGATWLGAGRIDAATILLGVAIGLPAAAVLTINNHRDRVADVAIGRRTLAIRLGPGGAVALYAAELVLASLLAAAALAPSGVAASAPALAMAAPALALAAATRATPIGPGLNRRLAQTAAYQLALAAIVALALVLTRQAV